MTIHPNCKINLGLHIVEKRPDGYHNIETIFYPVKQLHDQLEIVPSDNFEFEIDGIVLDCAAEDNLCIKAYNLIKADYPDKIGNVSIKLKKHIPFGAGLGGGSADAAFTLSLINRIFDLELSDEQLQTYARRIGADCAFFIKNQPVYATEKGDIFEDINLSLKNYILLIVKPDVYISTAEAYSGVCPQKSAHNLKEIITKPMAEWREYMHNDFEKTIFEKHPLLAHIKKMMYSYGALYAAMSGSGSTIYGIFEKNAQINTKEFENKGITYIIDNFE
jgi:4-diphosphocytidyl-2-C-methyl-D-erythritol kinase